VVTVQTKIPGHFYEKLHQWEDARRVYDEELIREGHSRDEMSHTEKTRKTEKRKNAVLGKMRCLEALGEW